MRGKPQQNASRPRRAGITPAHAGKTRFSYVNIFNSRDHPRACGENKPLNCATYVTPGSPPRMRGKPDILSKDFQPGGITPAHAGKTCSVTPLRCGERDHPRACGENRASGAESGMRTGSPPRMRGKPLNAEFGDAYTRITPAHAGKTHRSAVAVRRRGDHPRACGENRTVAVGDRRWLGSPPRMRGKPFHNFGIFNLLGITPAHAGKT